MNIFFLYYFICGIVITFLGYYLSKKNIVFDIPKYLQIEEHDLAIFVFTFFTMMLWPLFFIFILIDILFELICEPTVKYFKKIRNG